MEESVDSAYRGRMWVNTNPTNRKNKFFPSENIPKIRLISYTLLSKSAASSIDYSVYTGPWEERSLLLLNELLSYSADIICLQNVDEYSSFWSPKLQSHGYDCIFQLKTQERDFHKEGILIAYRRENFTILRSLPIFYNKIPQDPYMLAKYSPILCERCVTDDVGLVAFITPRDRHAYPTSFLVATSSLFREMNSDSSDIREVQSYYLMKRLEYENRDHHWPIILSMNLYDEPDSGAYHLIRTGRFSMISKPPKPCLDLTAVASSRATALLSWLLPLEKEIADEPIEKYEIQIRVAGGLTHVNEKEKIDLKENTVKISALSSHIPLGFQPCLIVKHGDCVRYKTIKDEEGRKKVVADTRLYASISGLSAEIPYEFRIRGENKSGIGEWSESSCPIMLENPEKSSHSHEEDLLNALPGLLEVKEFSNFEKSDHEIANFSMEDLPYISSFTHSSPRLLDGSSSTITSRIRGLPVDCNPREGWLRDLNGEVDNELKKELNREISIEKSILRHNKGEFIEKKLSEFDNLGLDSEVEKAKNENILSKLPSLLLDARVLVDNLGIKDKRDGHNLLLYSAYENYSSGGEPLYNSLFFQPLSEFSPSFSCLNYVFYSAGPFYPYKILNFPILSQLYESKSDGEEIKITPSFSYLQRKKDKKKNFLNENNEKNQENDENSSSKDSLTDLKLQIKKKLLESKKEKQIFYSKYSILNIEKNNLKHHYYLPNADFGSTHFALGVDFYLDTSKLATCYK